MSVVHPLRRLVVALAGLALFGAGLQAATPAAAPALDVAESDVVLLAAASSTTFEKQVLTLINKARASKRKCGSVTYSAAKPLKWNAKLAKAAEAHSKDMSKKNYFSHTSKSGLSPFQRIKKAGYKYKAAGETLAAGYATAKGVVNAWLKSPGHCKILMSKSYTQVGIGYYLGGGKYRHYTTADFGKPK